MPKGAKSACARCGFIRTTHTGAVVCTDCRYVMSKEEWAIWSGKDQDVELSHGTIEEDQAA